MTTQTPDAVRPPLPVRIARALENEQRLDPAVEAAGELTAPLGAPGLGDALRGSWLGHALHPSLTDVPLGLWTAASVLDLAGGPAARPAAQRLLGLGLLGVAPTAASGWATWHRLDRPAQRVGVAHAALNVAAMGLYAGSWVARRSDRHRFGVALALVGAGVAGAASYLGGHLSLSHDDGAPGSTTRAAAADTVSAPLSSSPEKGSGSFTSADVRDVVTAAHTQLRSLVDHARLAVPAEHDQAMSELLRHLSGHEAVEGLLVHPLLPQLDGGGVGVERLIEEEGIAQQIRRLEEMDATTPIYRTQFSLFDDALMKHLTSEEEQELPEVVARLHDDDAAVIVEAFLALGRSARARTGSYAEMLQQAKEEANSLSRS